MSLEKRNVYLLSGCQALFQSSLIINIIASGLLGLDLAGNKSLSTLPITMLIVAAAILMIPASFFMRRFGRRPGFILGSLFGIAGGLLAAAAIAARSFTLFVLANMLLGAFQAFAQYYRFAAADAASPGFKSQAISWVVAGGFGAALLGPALARFTQSLSSVAFVPTYLAISILALCSIALLALTDLPRDQAVDHTEQGERPLSRILAQPVFMAALAGSAVGFCVMSLIMTATPLAMQVCGFGFDSAASVIQWHVLGMFFPSFFTGYLIKRFGPVRMMMTGLALFALHIATAASGLSFAHFAAGLVMLGIGWNFLFVGGTALLTESYRPSEKAKTQAVHDFLVFGSVSLSTLAAGSLMNRFGWDVVNLAAIPLMLLAFLALLRLIWQTRRQTLAAKAAGI